MILIIIYYINQDYAMILILNLSLSYKFQYILLLKYDTKRSIKFQTTATYEEAT